LFNLYHACYMLHPSHPPSFDNSNNIWWRVQIMKLHIWQFSPASCHFIPLRSKYFPQHPVLKSFVSVLWCVGVISVQSLVMTDPGRGQVSRNNVIKGYLQYFCCWGSGVSYCSLLLELAKKTTPNHEGALSDKLVLWNMAQCRQFLFWNHVL
jgi:hypothetical protein